jgi:S1-C subfamily serine protease
MVVPAKEAMRIVRSLEVHFASGQVKIGSAFIAPVKGRLLTCAHVVTDEQKQPANRVIVRTPNSGSYEAKILTTNEIVDLACIEASETIESSTAQENIPEVGEQIVFAGSPQGVTRSSVFPGMISAIGKGLISFPRCEVIQIAGMINNGNSGGPLLDVNGAVLGVITAKYVPLLREIDKLRQDLGNIPQFPRDVLIGQIDFSAFVNLTIKSIWQMAAVLRLVQVGTGWAVPAKYFNLVGGK